MCTQFVTCAPQCSGVTHGIRLPVVNATSVYDPISFNAPNPWHLLWSFGLPAAWPKWGLLLNFLLHCIWPLLTNKKIRASVQAWGLLGHESLDFLPSLWLPVLRLTAPLSAWDTELLRGCSESIYLEFNSLVEKCHLTSSFLTVSKCRLCAEVFSWDRTSFIPPGGNFLNVLLAMRKNETRWNKIESQHNGSLKITAELEKEERGRRNPE